MIHKETIGMASDHAGYEMKEFVKGQLQKAGYEIVDFGTHSADSCDYADFAQIGRASCRERV